MDIDSESAREAVGSDLEMMELALQIHGSFETRLDDEDGESDVSQSPTDIEILGSALGTDSDIEKEKDSIDVESIMSQHGRMLAFVAQWENAKKRRQSVVSDTQNEVTFI